MRSRPFPSLCLEIEAPLPAARGPDRCPGRGSRDAGRSAPPRPPDLASRQREPKVKAAPERLSSASSCLRARSRPGRLPPAPSTSRSARESRSPGSRRTACSRWWTALASAPARRYRSPAEAMSLSLVRTRLEDRTGPSSKAASGSPSSSSAFGQDETRGDVLGEALSSPSRQRRMASRARPRPCGTRRPEGRRPGDMGSLAEALLVSANRAEGSRIIGRRGPAERRDRVRHALFVIRGGVLGVNHSGAPAAYFPLWFGIGRRGRLGRVASNPPGTGQRQYVDESPGRPSPSRWPS